jgi:hypothetical protein
MFHPADERGELTFLTERDLHLVTGSRTADLMWANGRVPIWINIHVEDVSEEATHLRLRCSAKLVLADEAKLPRDLAADETDSIEPFRIRGPAMPPGWRSVGQDGRIRLRRSERAG